MRTQPRPSEIKPGRRFPIILFAEIVMAIGVVLTVLGIYEVGRLFNLGLGLLLIFASSPPLILDAGPHALDDELRLLIRGE